MLVRNWMKRPTHTVKPKDSALHARALLEKHRINQLPVLAGGELIGIVTDRDLRDIFPSVFEAAVGSSERPAWPDPERVTVEAVMTTHVATVAPSDHVADAARLMRKERIGSTPVVDNGQIVGILTRSDLLDALVTLATDAEPVR